MSQIIKGIFGALAVTLAFGALQFASGHDLVGRQTVSLAPETGVNRTGLAPETGVNRTAKADRVTVVPSPTPTQTIALRFDSLADTSILLRVPVVKNEARSRPTPPQVTKSGVWKRTVACEPVVSILTEVAKRLEPGRCIT
jgi:hypothetical protein